MKKQVNHKQNAVRFCIAIFWMILIGLAYTAYSNASNAHAIGWATWLFYGVSTAVVIYIGIFATKFFWSLK